MTDIEITPKPQPRIVIRKRFQCPFCSFSRATKRLVVEHIARCWHDPANKTCRSCVFFERGHLEGYVLEREVPDACALGEPVQPKEPVVGCHLWQDRDLEEDEPAEDDVDLALRELLDADGGKSR